MVSFLAFKAIGVAAAMALGMGSTPLPPNGPPPDGLAQLPSDPGGSAQPGPDGPGAEVPAGDAMAGDAMAGDAAGPVAAPDIPGPETWVSRQFAGFTFKTPDNPQDILREEDFVEFVLWEPEDPDLYIILGAALNDKSYADLLDELKGDNFDVTERGMVQIGPHAFHEIRVRDPAAELPYLDRAYYAAEPNAEGLYVEFYGFASLPDAESYDPAILAFLGSVASDGAAAATTLADDPDATPGTAEVDSGAVTAYSMGGLTIDIPAAWPVIQESDDEMAVGMMDEADGPPVGVAAGFMLSEDSLEQFIADAERDGVSVLEGDTILIDGLPFQTFEADMSQGPISGSMKGLVSAVPNADGQYVAVMTTVMGQPWETHADALERVLASARLAEGASFGPQSMDQDDSATAQDPADTAELAAQALERGQALQAEGDYVGALKAYRESLLLEPNDALLARVETLERYLKVKGIEVPRQD